MVIGYDEKGAPITKSVTAVSKNVCQEKLEELKVKCGVVTGRAKPDMLFGDWIDLWYQTWSKPGLRITTQQCYEDRIYHRIIPHVGEIPLCKLTQSDLQQFYAELKRNGRRIRRDLYGPGLSDRMVRKPGTGGIYELNGHLFEGRYSPTNAQGKREVHTVYAKTKEECETLLEQMIAEVRERINEDKQWMKAENMTESRVSS